jgi:hypothetical protein
MALFKMKITGEPPMRLPLMGMKPIIYQRAINGLA